MRHVQQPKATTMVGRDAKHLRSISKTPFAGIDRNARIAVVHDWCPNFRGGEQVLARICKIFPRAEVFTLFDFLPKEIKEEYFPGVNFHVSGMNRLPFVEKYYRSLFFLCPFMIEQFDVTGYDAVISSSAAFSRGVLTRPDQPHLCYVHSPVRYAWDEQFSYLQQARLGFGPKGLAFRYLLHRLRSWDTRTAHGPDLMLANSNYVRSRIERIYGRDARVVHPPVAIEDLDIVVSKDDYYVTAAFHAPYKRTDLIIEAFSKTPSRRLIVVGDEVQSRHLRSLAGPNIVFTGYLPRHEYIEKIANARAMVFAGCEDFGITLAEAQACGTPLIAFGRGGARDIVRPLGESAHPTGVLFDRQSVDSVAGAIDLFEKNALSITPHACRMNATRFSEERFDLAILDALGLAQSVQLARATEYNELFGAESSTRDINGSLVEPILQ
ncbi:MAG: glycosyltransferase family 4 protein [Mesorhizobium sp.]|uniref:glycosyltransferase n=1 Tax=Mesorhizobium sp. TaxID=1871066 RepID=UPI00122306B8|nr:glycosyltransferase [Mesorhizobium sp.]TIL94212.1 MAG: glycosyltransferase family 4 protein [Mesorhizobium sp.]TIM02453.1 MAG: glycosyltransferase family 4 protein [Mesorhizobium sp.]TIM36991.1 MAG: glycosyltransferase family 4 protein [Mesorhizobium sp.]